jgi:hypothetical protein
VLRGSFLDAENAEKACKLGTALPLKVVTLKPAASGRAWRLEAQHDRPLPRPYRLDHVEGKRSPLREQAASTDDDPVGMVGVPLVADVVEPAQLSTVSRHHPVARRGSEQPTELRLLAQALLSTLLPAPLGHATEA